MVFTGCKAGEQFGISGLGDFFSEEKAVSDIHVWI